jgi:gamma-glutamyltranspeptidase
VNVEGRVPRAITDQLSALGHKVTVTADWSNGSAPTVILKQGGVLHGGADPRRSRFIFGR